MHRGLFIDGPCWNKGSQSSCCTLLPEQLSVSSFFVVVVAFFFFLVNWVTDVLWLQNTLKLFHTFSGKRCLFKIHAEIIKLFNFTVNLSARDKSLFILPASTHMTSQAIYFLGVSRVSF